MPATGSTVPQVVDVSTAPPLDWIAGATKSGEQRQLAAKRSTGGDSVRLAQATTGKGVMPLT